MKKTWYEISKEDFEKGVTRQKYLGSNALGIELLQAKDEGKNVDHLVSVVEKIQDITDILQREEEANKIYDEIYNLSLIDGFEYVEPSTIEEIHAERPKKRKEVKPLPGEEVIHDKILAAWQGRIIGCMLGKPVEGWSGSKIVDFAKETNNYPIAKFFASNVSKEIKEKYAICDSAKPSSFYGEEKQGWINNWDCMPCDDDINYMVLALKLIDTFGKDFESSNVLYCWGNYMPALHAMTAERVAYRNYLLGMEPPETALRRNPYREWIGAQIRADVFGYVNLGNTEQAANMAFRDACVSHVKNGIYGAMFVAAMLAWAAVCNNIVEVIEMGLAEIPKNCRLTWDIKKVLEFKANGVSQEQALKNIKETYNQTIFYEAVHTIPNAMVVVYALLYGENDFTKTIGLSVDIGFDTDCNGATVGSVFGMLNGTNSIPRYWLEPLNNTVRTSVFGYSECSITELASATIKTLKEMNG